MFQSNEKKKKVKKRAEVRGKRNFLKAANKKKHNTYNTKQETKKEEKMKNKTQMNGYKKVKLEINVYNSFIQLYRIYMKKNIKIMQKIKRENSHTFREWKVLSRTTRRKILPKNV